MNSVRIDAIYAAVFDASEKIEYSYTVPTSYQPTDDLVNYGLRLKLIFDGELSLPALTKINSVSLTVESTTVPVRSSTVLGATSDYFTKFFYGNFKQNNTGTYIIKEVN
ncbi:hypothetical protein PMAYCL1PPCAC_08814, partial [Pristionchus mayeri]